LGGFALINADATLSERLRMRCLYPGFQSKPWAGISQRFQRYSLF
jgi:hypothetical protein